MPSKDLKRTYTFLARWAILASASRLAEISPVQGFEGWLA
jgi:hypothetical protein